jgi:hypothetical protein
MADSLYFESLLLTDKDKSVLFMSRIEEGRIDGM